MSEPTVTIEQGTLRGTQRTDYDGHAFYSFQGIPYAKPPLGELRFKAPEPPEPWEGVWDAIKERDQCASLKLSESTLIGSEDCLYLNVFTPQIFSADSKAELKPVMVWIHGGRYVRGSGTERAYGPDYLMTQDVVYVTINYRLGCLGFLKLEDTSLEVPGNAGLKDQVMALKWIQKNISSFMGDPSNVTIFGVSAGAACVHLLMLSPMAKGLFHRAIIQSCSALHYWNKDTKSHAPKLAEELGIEFASEKDFFQRLKQLPAEDILLAQRRMKEPYPVDLVRPFGPVVENPSDKPRFLGDKPINVIRSGNYNHVPLMIGYNRKESMAEVLHKHRNDAEITPAFDFIIPYDLGIEKGSKEWDALIKRFKGFYFGNESDPKIMFDSYVDMFSDSCYIRRVYSTVKNHASNSKSPIFFYLFNFDGKANFYKKLFNVPLPGANHADELGYIFKSLASKYIAPGSLEEAMMRRMTKLWANFSRYGNPTPEKDELIRVVWKPVSNENELNYLNIGEEFSMEVNPDKERMGLWDEILQSNPSTFYL